MKNKDRKGSKNSVVDHLSRLVREKDELPLNDEFPNEHYIYSRCKGMIPWYANLVKLI